MAMHVLGLPIGQLASDVDRFEVLDFPDHLLKPKQDCVAIDFDEVWHRVAVSRETRKCCVVWWRLVLLDFA
jgi:hypothetical protein